MHPTLLSLFPGVASLLLCIETVAFAQEAPHRGSSGGDSTILASRDSAATMPATYAYSYVEVGSLAPLDEDRVLFGSISHHFSSATRASTRLSGFGTLGVGFGFAPTFLLNGGVGAELHGGGFSVGISAGIMGTVFPFPFGLPYLEGTVGYEVPVDDRVGIRLQAGSIAVPTDDFVMVIRADLGIVMR